MRLTKDLKTPHDDTTYADDLINVFDRENIVLTKLKHYEDIEEELGIDLITLFKALKNGVYVKSRVLNGFMEPEKIRLTLDFSYTLFKQQIETKVKGIKLIVGKTGLVLSEWNYGKTWALTREELENE